MLFRIQVVLVCEILAAFVTLFRPYWGLLFLIFLTFMGPSSDRPNLVPLHIPMVMTIAVLVATVARPAYFRERIGVALRESRAYFGFCLLVLLAAVASGWSYYSSYQVEESFTVLVVVGLMLIWLDRPQRVLQFFWTVLACGLYYVRTVIQNPKFMQEEIGGTEFNRISFRHETNFGNPNFLAILMVMMIFLALALVKHYRSIWIRVALIASILAYFYVFLRCQSRGATLGLAGGLIATWLLQRRKVLFAAVVTVCIAIGLTYFAPANYVNRLKTIVNYQEDKSATGRLEMWATSQEVIAANPMFGIGPGNYEPRFPGTSQHNAYLQVASEVGLPALLLYMWLLLSGFGSVFRSYRASGPEDGGDPFLRSVSVGLCAFLVAIAVQGFFTGFGYREFVYITLALIRSLRTLAVNREELEEGSEAEVGGSAVLASA